MKKSRSQSIFFIIVSASVAASLSMLGGIGLEFTAHDILPIVPIVIALPALNTLVADYATIIAAHAGNPDERTLTRRMLVRSVFKSSFVNIIGTFVFCLVLASNRGYSVSLSFSLVFLAFMCVSIIGAIIIMLVSTRVLDKLLEKRQSNPDDIILPIVTTIANIFVLSVVSLSALMIF